MQPYYVVISISSHTSFGGLLAVGAAGRDLRLPSLLAGLLPLLSELVPPPGEDAAAAATPPTPAAGPVLRMGDVNRK